MEMVNSFQAKYLRGLAHKLKPVVFIGQKGLTPTVIQSTEEALNRHELIKIKVRVDKGAEAEAIGEDLARRVPCHLVKRIGKVLIVFAPSPESA